MNHVHLDRLGDDAIDQAIKAHWLSSSLVVLAALIFCVAYNRYFPVSDYILFVDGALISFIAYKEIRYIKSRADHFFRLKVSHYIFENSSVGDPLTYSKRVNVVYADGDFDLNVLTTEIDFSVEADNPVLDYMITEYQPVS